MPAPVNTTNIFPWGLHPLDSWIANELQNRAKEYDMNPVTATNPLQAGTKTYSGPKTAWVRVFSNGISTFAPNLQGFVMGGTQGFNDSYGFVDAQFVVIGVDASGQPHKLVSSELALGNGKHSHLGDFPRRPPPSVVSVETEFSGGSNSGFSALCRKTKISWTCYSLSQLEYLAPYFLTPRISVLTEWGWNYYDPSVLVDLQDTNYLYGIFQGAATHTSDLVKKSSGNYDLAMGFITDYDFNMNDVGGYDCSTTITNANYLLAGRSYQNGNTQGTDPNQPSNVIQLKDFSEFVYDDAHNLLSIKTPQEISAQKENKDQALQSLIYGNYGQPNTGKETPTVTGNKFNFNTTGRVFTTNQAIKSGNEKANTSPETWLRMDLIAEIINTFFTINFVNQQLGFTGTQTTTLDINNVVVCAHPALKSVSKDIIIPNQYAPRFVAKDSSTVESALQLGNIKISSPTSPNGTYYSLFPDVNAVIKEYNYDESYDDICSIVYNKASNNNGVIAPTNNSFPQFSEYTPPNGAPGGAKAGYWGYLQHIFVSLSLFKELVSKNDTVLKLIEELIQHIGRSMCDIAQLKIVPDTNGNQMYSIVDTNYTSITNKKTTRQLPRISLGSINSAYVKTVEFGVKLSADMSNQMIMQSASGTGNSTIPTGTGITTVDPKTMVTSRFAAGDRMFWQGVITPVVISNSDPSSQVAQLKRLFTADGQGCANLYTYRWGKQKQQIAILCELDDSFLKGVLLDIKNKDAIYTNNSIMPGTEIKLEFLGIGGFTFLSQFTLDHVPSMYSYEQSVWQVSGVSQKVENKMWTTSVTAQPRPLTAIA